MSDDKLSVIHTDQDKMKASIENMKRNMGNIKEMVGLTAQMRKVQYDAFVNAGFTEEQALTLVMNS